MKRALNQEGNYVNIFRNYNKGYFKFASRNFYSEFLAAVTVAKQLERSGTLTFDKPQATISVRMPAYANAPKLCSYLGISSKELGHYNPSLRKPVFDGTKYIPKDYLLKLPYRFANSSLLSGAPRSLFSSKQKRSKFYQVRPGDTAGGIAAAHKVSLKSLIKANHLNRHGFIRVGQNLRIPSASAAISPIKAGNPSISGQVVLQDTKKISPLVIQPILRIEEDHAVSGNLSVVRKQKTSGFTIGHVEVQPDESIGLFSEWLKLTPKAIRLSNSLGSGEDIHPGQTITLEFLNVSPEDFELLRFDFHQEIQEDFFNSYKVIDVVSYQVSNGDTIWDLCYKKFDVPLWLLKKYNDTLNYTRLDTSSRLNIPVLKEI